jgi:transcription initiation factor IIE alpha subunit
MKYVFKLASCREMANNSKEELDSEACDGIGPLERAFHSAAARIVDFLIIHKGSDFSESEIADMTRLSTKTVNRAMPQLISNNIAQLKRIVSGRTKMYWLHPKSKAAVHLEEFVYELASNLAQEEIHQETEISTTYDQQQLKIQNP